MTAPIAIIMGSTSDWPTMEHAANALDALGIPYETKAVSYTHLTLPTKA